MLTIFCALLHHLCEQSQRGDYPCLSSFPNLLILVNLMILLKLKMGGKFHIQKKYHTEGGGGGRGSERGIIKDQKKYVFFRHLSLTSMRCEDGMVLVTWDTL